MTTLNLREHLTEHVQSARMVLRGQHDGVRFPTIDGWYDRNGKVPRNASLV